MRSRQQYRTDIGVREKLITAALDFAGKASRLDGVQQIALIGSITTDKPDPKDVDLLITVNLDTVDLPALAILGRQLKGSLQQINSGADIFLLDTHGKYIGRICHYRECPSATRTSCRGLNCSLPWQIPHLCDDLHDLDLNTQPATISTPPAVIYPNLIINHPLPDDLLSSLGG